MAWRAGKVVPIFGWMSKVYYNAELVHGIVKSDDDSAEMCSRRLFPERIYIMKLLDVMALFTLCITQTLFIRIKVYLCSTFAPLSYSPSLVFISHMRRFTSTVPARGARAPNRTISNSSL